MSTVINSAIHVFAPAKLNLSLAITDRRSDGFHNLLSLVAPIDLGDSIAIAPQFNRPQDMLECSDPELPTDGRNLALGAAHAFRTAWPALPPVAINLRKRIPVGAGLGGGSSNAAAVLQALNELAGRPFSLDQLVALARPLGADVPLFLYRQPVIMRGTGDEIQQLPLEAIKRLKGLQFLLFKPEFGIDTGWAYGALAQKGNDYYDNAAEADSRLEAWMNGEISLTKLMTNTFEKVIFQKYLVYKTLISQLSHGLNIPSSIHLTGSGSACFLHVQPLDRSDQRDLLHTIIHTLGPGTFCQMACIV